MLQVLGMFEQLFLLFMGDVLLDDDVVRILLSPCKLLVLYWGSGRTYTIIFPWEEIVVQSGGMEVFGMHTNECGPCIIDGSSVIPLLFFLLLYDAFDFVLAISGGEKFQFDPLFVLFVELLLLSIFLLLLLPLLLLPSEV